MVVGRTDHLGRDLAVGRSTEDRSDRRRFRNRRMFDLVVRRGRLPALRTDRDHEPTERGKAEDRQDDGSSRRRGRRRARIGRVGRLGWRGRLGRRDQFDLHVRIVSPQCERTREVV
jgi:hypothetical protein